MVEYVHEDAYMSPARPKQGSFGSRWNQHNCELEKDFVSIKDLKYQFAKAKPYKSAG